MRVRVAENRVMNLQNFLVSKSLTDQLQSGDDEQEAAAAAATAPTTGHPLDAHTSSPGGSRLPHLLHDLLFDRFQSAGVPPINSSIR